MFESVISARAAFTKQDLCFIESLHGEQHSAAIRQLTQDAESLHEILDQPDVRRALLESPVALPVSPSFYFYTLVRHALLESGVDHVGLTDHIAGVLANKLGRPSSFGCRGHEWATHAVDFMVRIQQASGLLKVRLEVEAGDQFLLLTGLFPDFLRERSERRGAPGVEFYGSFARQSYSHASSHRELGPESSEIFGLLAEVFPIAQRSLNRMREHCLFLGS
ncbi:MAG: hypothetical protein R3242_00395 [Akkermansiaceae bacterium]|nr:hypothetical protein [Akkermansiaceae bacterium]